MEATALSVGKSVLDGALGYAKSAVAEEVALHLGVQRDHAFIRDELEMMLAFLMAAHEERDDHKVVKTWVKQVRNVAYDVEDCLQDYAVRLKRPSWWCFLRTLIDRHRVAKQMKELRAKVEDVSQRNVRYRLIKDTTGPKSETAAGSSSIVPSATMFGIEEAKRQKDKAKVDLAQLINEGNQDLSVIAVSGTGGVLSQTVIIKEAYNNLKRSNKFELYAWIRIVHPFNPREFLQCIMRQIYQICFEETGEAQGKTSIGAQVLKKMGVMKQDDLVDAFNELVNEKSYLIVLNDLATVEEWDEIMAYFADNKKGSRIIVSTEHGEVAKLCAGQKSIVSELKQSSVDHSVFASYSKVSQNRATLLVKLGSCSSEATIGTDNFITSTVEINESQFVGNNNKIVRKSSTRTGTITGALMEPQIVGREKEKSDLINLISMQGEHMVISIWGMGGLGKTTLLKEVYQSQELIGLFEKRACVTIMHPFVLQDVLDSLLMQLDAESCSSKGIGSGLGRRTMSENQATVEELGTLGREVTTEALVEKLNNLLKVKRCLIVLDDLSSLGEWDMIIRSLPKINSVCRIVITTREENIAKHCSQEQENIYKLQVLEDSDALDLFTKKVFKEAINLEEYPTLMEEARMILKKCSGLPLAIVTIGGFLAKQPKNPIVWRKMNKHISAELQMNPDLGIIRAILMKSFDGLPYHLKSCFLYMSIFPEDYNISRRRLVRRWNAEGYSSEVRGKSMGEIADSYFMELIERSMVLPSKESIGSRKGISSCKLHDLMREICISRAMGENLVFRMEEGCNLNTQGAIRHLAISSNWEGEQSEFESTVDLSRIRSLTVFGNWKPFYIFDKMKLLRVLDLESTSGLLDHHLEPIWKLLHLKYLSLRECKGIFHLSESLGNLKQLETLDVAYTGIIKLPQAITKLRKLQYVRAGMLHNPMIGASTFEKLVKDITECWPKQIRNKLCVWPVMFFHFCLSICSLKYGMTTSEIKNEVPINRRDVWTRYCFVVFHILARLADPIGVAVPRGLRKLKTLHTLGTVNIAPGKVILQEIKRLVRLRKLAVTGINKKNCQEFCSTLACLSSLESLSVHSREKGRLRDCLDILRTPPENLQSLKLNGSLGKLPEWVAGLQNLVKLKLERTKLTEVDGTIQVLDKLPHLAILRLLRYSFKTEEHCHLSFCREAFPSLTVLERGSGAGIKSVLFEEGTALKLELLLGRGEITFSGLSCLPSLKEVMIHEYAESVVDVKNQLSRNPNKPVLKFF